MADSLLATFGIYGAALAIAFIGGMFPLVSLEVCLVAWTATNHVSIGAIALLALLGALGHQLAKTVTYYAATGTLEHGKLAAKVDKVRAHIDRWNKRPTLVVFAAATVGIPPIYLIGFIAHPLMRVPFWTFTTTCFVGRFLRYAVLAGVVPLLWK